ncbi:MAG: phosphatidate cytidylyltransferase [Pseudomonadota bacterium]
MVRAITAIVLAFAILSAIWFMPITLFSILIVVVTALAASEYSHLIGFKPLERILLVIAIVTTNLTMIFFADQLELSFILLVGIIFFLALYYMKTSADPSPVLMKLGFCSFGLVYIGITMAIWIWLRDLPGGREWVLLTLVPACLCDTFAYAFGKTIGKRKFAPQTSPNKTWEGFFGALLGSLVGAFVIRQIFIPTFSAWHTIAIAFGLWIVSPLGDLVESMLKRSLGVKDSGKLIPGHGGILDRLDALIFSGPFVYFYLKFIVGI